MAVVSTEMTKDQISLLLYLESRAVDHGGLIDSRQMNADDFQNAGLWDEDGFIEFGRVYSKHVKGSLTNWVHLTPEAWRVVQELRQQRSARLWENRNFLKSNEH